jgi:Aerobic-type carbon monoxide dehydrogenase, large subunit CoxL/CutL homologs
VPNLKVEYAMRNSHVPVGPWRGVNTNQNGVYSECFMDEVAKAAGKDPLEFRRQFMSKHPKHLGVLTPSRRRRSGGRPFPRACTAAWRSSWATAAIRPRSPKCR